MIAKFVIVSSVSTYHPDAFWFLYYFMTRLNVRVYVSAQSVDYGWHAGKEEYARCDETKKVPA